jgi:hypothetical protein
LAAAFAPPPFDDRRSERIIDAAQRASASRPSASRWQLTLGRVAAAAVALAAVAVVVVIGGRMLAASGQNAPPHPSTSPFQNSSLPIVTLSDGLAQMQRPVSLPDERVAGTPDAVVVDHGLHKQNKLYVHYPTGVFLQVRPLSLEPGGVFDARATVALSRASGYTHPDGSPVLRLERIAGRDTVVATEGWILQHGHQTPASGGNVVDWSQNGYVYVLEPLGPTHAASLATLLRVAASIPSSPPASAWTHVAVVAGAVVVLVLGGFAVLARRRRSPTS